MNLTTITYKSEAYWEMVELRNKILREPFGLVFSEDDLLREKDDMLCVAKNETNRIIACCVLTKKDESTAHLRQMAVSEIFQRQGFGSQILQFAEETARNSEYKTIILHARKTAVGFYAKHLYEVVGEEFIEVGMPHVEMVKRIEK
jgi:Predicted acyltransferase